MKPCRKNRQPLALLACNSLEPTQADALRLHLESCPGCRQYFAELSAVRELASSSTLETPAEPSAGFHRRSDARLRAASPRSLVLQFLDLGRQQLSNPALAAAAITFVLLTGLVILGDGPSRKPAAQPIQTAGLSHPSVPAPDNLAPTAANYYRALDQSFDKFDNLINRQALLDLPPAPILTASTPLETSLRD